MKKFNWHNTAYLYRFQPSRAVNVNESGDKIPDDISEKPTIAPAERFNMDKALDKVKSETLLIADEGTKKITLSEPATAENSRYILSIERARSATEQKIDANAKSYSDTAAEIQNRTKAALPG